MTDKPFGRQHGSSFEARRCYGFVATAPASGGRQSPEPGTVARIRVSGYANTRKPPAWDSLGGLTSPARRGGCSPHRLQRPSMPGGSGAHSGSGLSLVSGRNGSAIRPSRNTLHIVTPGVPQRLRGGVGGEHRAGQQPQDGRAGGRDQPADVVAERRARAPQPRREQFGEVDGVAAEQGELEEPHQRHHPEDVRPLLQVQEHDRRRSRPARTKKTANVGFRPT